MSGFPRGLLCEPLENTDLRLIPVVDEDVRHSGGNRAT